MKQVVILGPMEKYKGELEEDAEIWSINFAYRKQGPPIHRVFMLDPLSYCNGKDQPEGEYDRVVKEINDLDCILLSSAAYEEIPKSEAFPLDELVHHFGGIEFFTSSIAYAFALAIAEGFESIVLPGLSYINDGWEYAVQKPCLDFWAGMAVMAGIQLVLPRLSGLCKPWPWEPSRYGYVENKNDQLCYSTIAASYRACVAYPIAWFDPHGDHDKEVDWYKNTVPFQRVLLMDIKRKRFPWEPEAPPMESRKATPEEIERAKRTGNFVRV